MWPKSDQTQELLRSAREGKAEAVGDLLERHREALKRMVELRMDPRIRGRVDVSDVVQETMIDAHRRIRDYLASPQIPFHLWLRQIARDRMIDAHRRHRVSGRRSVDREQAQRGPQNLDHSTLDLVAQLCDGSLTPAARATQRELAQRVEEALAHLDETDREIMLLRHYEQLSNQQAAEALGLSEPAASMRYLRALRRLKALLAEALPPGGDP